MAIFEVVLQQRYFNQTIINRFHYIGSGTPAAVQMSFGLLHATGWLASRLSGGLFPNDTLAGQLQAAQNPSVETIAAYARDLYSDFDFYEAPFPTPPVGTKGGEAVSPAVAYGLFGSRVNASIRRGQKRFVGVSETMVGAGGVLGAEILAVLANVAAQMSTTLTYDDEGNTLTYVPCVLQFEEYTTPSGKKAYRKYPTAAAQLAHAAQGGIWSPYTTVRTQVSRQYGRGV